MSERHFSIIWLKQLWHQKLVKHKEISLTVNHIFKIFLKKLFQEKPIKEKVCLKRVSKFLENKIVNIREWLFTMVSWVSKFHCNKIVFHKNPTFAKNMIKQFNFSLNAIRVTPIEQAAKYNITFVFRNDTLYVNIFQYR